MRGIKTSVEDSERCMVSLIALVWLMVHCFLWLSLLWWMERIIMRKGYCTIKGLVICYDAAKISWVGMGWPGSVHDNRVWSNSEIYLGRDKYFNTKEYLLGDSAFLTSAVMVPAAKKGHNANIIEEKKYSNIKLGKVRIKSEHWISLLKAWFQRLRGFSWVIHNKTDLDSVLKSPLCACVLHNLLIEHPVPIDWFDDDIV